MNRLNIQILAFAACLFLANFSQVIARPMGRHLTEAWQRNINRAKNNTHPRFNHLSKDYQRRESYKKRQCYQVGRALCLNKRNGRQNLGRGNDALVAPQFKHPLSKHPFFDKSRSRAEPKGPKVKPKFHPLRF